MKLEFKDSDLDYVWFLILTAEQHKEESTAQMVNYTFKKVLKDFMIRSGLDKLDLQIIAAKCVLAKDCGADEALILSNFIKEL
jgi:hypothetical protein